jgi:hypothetical protein
MVLLLPGLVTWLFTVNLREQGSVIFTFAVRQFMLKSQAPSLACSLGVPAGIVTPKGFSKNAVHFCLEGLSSLQ